MAFYEREFIEIKRDNYKMKIVGPLKCSVEQEDVRQYIMACVRKEKIAIEYTGLIMKKLQVLKNE